ncbi:MAG: LysR substrate-binding domain-containing protein [Pseudomonadota bacterium]|uniref:LysR family transcriptional regulator n=1 Tax=Gallaecimonas pentaromativorans TaxID=584787 RepID=A0A3N1PBG9_9GAMM|nr:LysR family transcriptional regulator [Gallaecimonas pentaromativorans]MED5525219.1 LysR substrate-binding domain-containing protein [Pseudomonadota bacterium]ROQ24180.1 LysR family transcriptional regulator [Gallaecimonas pentaromativorans]
MALDTLTSMTVFCDAIAHGSLAAAARHNGISAEMAGRHLSALESRLGVRLINRSTRKLHLTDAGRSYLERCRHILDEMRAVEAEVGALQHQPSGQLRIAAPLAFTTSVLAPAVNEFMNRYPQITLRFELSEREVDLLAGGFDVALRLGELPDSGLVAHPLGRFALLLVASPAYLATQPITNPEQLGSSEALLYSRTSSPQQLALSRGNERQTVALHGQLTASDIGFLVEMALLGKGVLLAPSFVVAPHLANGRLRQVLPEWSARQLPFHALVPHRALLPSTVRAFIDFLKAWLAGQDEIVAPNTLL